MTYREAISVIVDIFNGTDEELAEAREALTLAASALAFADYMGKVHTCNDCGKAKSCGHTPALSDPVRYNCYDWEGRG